MAAVALEIDGGFLVRRGYVLSAVFSSLAIGNHCSVSIPPPTLLFPSSPFE